eukprot:gb/GFBE01060926.1/.p1 GENE.gb/GFBE01060926.1/~~gb/GFBE01060926.1/.p1  ORF type:complete len:347 (+),score=63.18 gb/GFBE01060926.1/:1-1041(+)
MLPAASHVARARPCLSVPSAAVALPAIRDPALTRSVSHLGGHALGEEAGGHGQVVTVWSGWLAVPVGVICVGRCTRRSVVRRRATGTKEHKSREFQQKLKNDQVKQRIYARHLREIEMAARGDGGLDRSLNRRLDDAIKAALRDNVKKDTIDGRLAKIEGGSGLEEIMFQGYGPGGSAVLVACVTDSKARTKLAVQTAFQTVGGQLAGSGSVERMFSSAGVIRFDQPDDDEDSIMEAALDAGCEDCATLEDGSMLVLTQPDDFEAVCEGLSQKGLEPTYAKKELYSPERATLVEEHAYELLRLEHLLDECDDVQHISFNVDLPKDLELSFSFGSGKPWPYSKRHLQ